MFYLFHAIAQELLPIPNKELNYWGDYKEALIAAKFASNDQPGLYVHVQDSDGYLVALYMSGTRIGLKKTWS